MPEYNLVDVRAAARNLSIEYRGRNVFRDTANIGYDLNDVADCLCRLTAEDYRKTHWYADEPPDDEYICTYVKATDEDPIVDELYVKFRLLKDTLIVDLGSFHLPRF